MMNYWKEMYGTSTKEFVEGVIAGIKAFAVWDGEQLVGVERRPLEEVIKEVKEGLGYKDED